MLWLAARAPPLSTLSRAHRGPPAVRRLARLEEYRRLQAGLRGHKAASVDLTAPGEDGQAVESLVQQRRAKYLSRRRAQGDREKSVRLHRAACDTRSVPALVTIESLATRWLARSRAQTLEKLAAFQSTLTKALRQGDGEGEAPAPDAGSGGRSGKGYAGQVLGGGALEESDDGPGAAACEGDVGWMRAKLKFVHHIDVRGVRARGVPIPLAARPHAPLV